MRGVGGAVVVVLGWVSVLGWGGGGCFFYDLEILGNRKPPHREARGFLFWFCLVVAGVVADCGVVCPRFLSDPVAHSVSPP